MIPVGAGTLALPSVGVESTNQSSACVTGVTIGEAVIVGTTNAGFGATGRNVTKAVLRSQNMPFTFLAMPAGVICFAEKVVDLPERVLGSIHVFR